MRENNETAGLRRLRGMNNDVASAISEFLDETPDLISQDMIDTLLRTTSSSVETLVKALVSAYCGVSDYEDPKDPAYIEEGLQEVKTELLLNNPYYKHIRLPDCGEDGWNFSHLSYDPYEIFVRDDLMLKPDYMEIVPLGYFRSKVTYPVVMQRGREWMAIKPSEINSMAPAIEAVKGDVAVFGLGLGYFAYMASLKESVTSVTIVEIDERIISLFEKYVLPQFCFKEKIRIVRADAFDYMKDVMPSARYDYAFVDLWHSTDDGLDLYLKSKRLAARVPQTHFLYWIEEFLLSALRWREFDNILDKASSISEALSMLSDDALRTQAEAKDVALR